MCFWLVYTLLPPDKSSRLGARGAAQAGGRGGVPAPSLKLQNNKSNCFFLSTIKVCVSCSWQCLETSLPSATHWMMFLYLCSSGSNVRNVLRATQRTLREGFWRVSSQCKKPFNSPRLRLGVEVKNLEWQIKIPDSDKFSLKFGYFYYFSRTHLEWTF